MPKLENLGYKNIFIILLIQLFALQLNGQNVLYEEVSFDTTKASTAYFLKSIEDQANVVFSYSNMLCFEESIELSRSSATIREILNELFIKCPSSFLVRGNKIIIQPYEGIPGKHVIRGYIRDAKSKEALIQANIYDEDQLLGTVSNNFGFYSLTLPAGYTRLNCSYVGYEHQEMLIDLQSDTVIHFDMIADSEIREISIIKSKVPNKVKSTRTGTVDLPIEQIKNVPVFLGEVDLVKSIQLLPGIQSGGEGLSALYVRGGGPDQNMVLMDDVPVYNVGHLLGFFSIFNADAVNHVSVVKGGFPARYGGRLSSVVDIRMYDGNDQEFKGLASIGVLSSRVAAEGPLIKDKSSFSVSIRRTYMDIFTGLLQLNDNNKSRFYFYDFNSKFNLKLGYKDRIYVSSYLGKDQYDLQYNFQNIEISANETNTSRQVVEAYDESDIGWKNAVFSSRWNHIFGEKVFVNTTASYSDYQFYIGQKVNYQSDGDWTVVNQNYYSGIKDYTLKTDWDYIPRPAHYFRFGASLTAHNFYPGIDVYLQENTGSEAIDTTYGGNRMFRPELRLYVEDDFNLTDNLRLNIGGHFSAFQTESKYYWSAEPRFSARYLINDRMSVKAAYSHMTQYMHLLRTSSVSMPTDMWLPVSDEIKPMRATQTAFGWEYEIGKGFGLSIEAYYKSFSDILAYKESTSYFDFTSDWRNKLTAGDGESKGIEFLLHKKTGSLSGWFGYTYSKTINQFEELNNGNPFPADFDRTHDASLFLMYRFKKGITLSGTWTFGTGSPITLPETKYYAPDLPTQENEFDTKYNQYISERNSYRMPNFHRLDMGVNFEKEKPYGSRVWSFGLLNAYGRQNPFFLYFSDTEQDNGDIKRSLKQFSLFPFPIPYARFTIQF
ncbi:TonB-dependent receptor [Carboxylicivirga caseinilyticus]|uniref:TonB-dependent receptor n=1 Tax=Carboxylicivirga caseinilyticus TaxID=3417572 RepID=UPI003D34E1F4|nr:TonB-dependent receptor [Marinilabiliaceae bacterium A049]